MINVGEMNPFQRGWLNKELDKYSKNTLVFEKMGKFTYITNKSPQLMRWGLAEMTQNNND